MLKGLELSPTLALQYGRDEKRRAALYDHEHCIEGLHT